MQLYWRHAADNAQRLTFVGDHDRAFHALLLEDKGTFILNLPDVDSFDRVLTATTWDEAKAQVEKHMIHLLEGELFFHEQKVCSLETELQFLKERTKEVSYER